MVLHLTYTILHSEFADTDPNIQLIHIKVKSSKEAHNLEDSFTLQPIFTFPYQASLCILIACYSFFSNWLN